MVPAAGLEPARRLSRGILSPLCLPIPPSGLSKVHSAYISIIFVLASRALNWLLLLLLNELFKNEQSSFQDVRWNLLPYISLCSLYMSPWISYGLPYLCNPTSHRI